MVEYGGLGPVSAVLVNAALIAYLSLFPALFAMVMARLTSVFGASALLVAPLVWVATELGRTHIFTGFPWVLLGYSQVTMLPVAQLASILGVYGVSGLTGAVSAAMACAAVRANVSMLRRFTPLAVTLVLVFAVSGWGAGRVGAALLTRSGEAIRVGLVQGNVDQGMKWDRGRSAAIFAEYLRMTRTAIARGAEIVLWPESSTPFFFEDDRAGAEQIKNVARQANVPILLGSDQIDPGAPTKYYNSAFLVRPDGSVGGVYRKMHLVPFGEYVPLKQIFFFAAPLVEAVSDFSPGESAVLLPVKGHVLSTAICYEIVYPDLVRQFAKAGSELLTTITNDAWFGRTSAPYQHFAQASMRAIENGRYLVRSANTGISGIVDPYGRVLEPTDIFQQSVVVGDARFVNDTTIYTRIGDVFAYASTVVTVVLLVLARRVGHVK